MGLKITTVDAFTDHRFAGNPAAVCVLPEDKDEAFLRDLAREMNLSETAFLRRREDGFGLRWFTPTVEVALCGHATLASAHVLWEDGHLAPGAQARFHTKSGLLTADRDRETIWLDFPARGPEPVEAPAGLAEALGVSPRFVGRTQFDYLVEVESEQAVRAVRPDFGRLAALPVRGVIVTARAASREYDFVSRFFAPAAGVNEDPVTGSAHCALGPFWEAKLGKSELLAFQASARGGRLRVRCRGERVGLGGQAVTVMRGELL